jgi:hypothetical protein
VYSHKPYHLCPLDEQREEQLEIQERQSSQILSCPKNQTRSIRTWLVICPRVECRNPIKPSRQASRYIGRQNAIHRGVVQRPKIRKVFRIRWYGLTEPCQLLNNDMGMANNIPVRIDFDRASHESRFHIREMTRIEVTDCNLHGERLGLRQRSKVRRENELG